MTISEELWVQRDALRNTRTVRAELPALTPGEVLVAIDRFALTANNVSYAVSGDTIGYWGYFPAEGEWGKVPVWGCGTVVATNDCELPVGERLWGFFPMASHVILRPGPLRNDYFNDAAEHRQALPDLYNQYRRTRAEPAFLQNMETERCLYFPLFATSYVLSDFLHDNDFFGAGQVIIGSASSKTGFGLAKMLKSDPQLVQRIVGVTSAANEAFVRALGCYDEVVLYGQEEEQVDSRIPAAYVDMSGDLALTTTLHNHLGENMVQSTMVGATHWEGRGDAGELPGARPTFFFAPAQIAKRNAEWGPGIVMMKAMEASAAVAKSLDDILDVQWVTGVAQLDQKWRQMLDNKVPPTVGLMVRPGEEID